ncbi:MAG: Kae1-associated kinase Bud32 [Desulfurococcales archaeon]|nr:Kae1-associated kinase Bud32 [Desulfurococcales archaeon]
MDALEELAGLLTSGKMLSMGAEAAVYLTSFMGENFVVKYRFPKKYIHPLLAEELIVKRTKREARVLLNTRLNGLCVPRLFFTMLSKGILVMEKINGSRLDELIGKVYPGEEQSTTFSRIYYNIGVVLGKLHSMNIIHGDFSVSNLMIKDEGLTELCIIDFGLSDFSNDPEDRAMDLRILFKSMESRFPRYLPSFRDKVIQGYKAGITGFNFNSVIQRLREMELRGRYVKERRRKHKTSVHNI